MYTSFGHTIKFPALEVGVLMIAVFVKVLQYFWVHKYTLDTLLHTDIIVVWNPQLYTLFSFAYFETWLTTYNAVVTHTWTKVLPTSPHVLLALGRYL